MISPTVRYHNDLNALNFHNWTALEMNFFMTVIAKSKNKGTDEYFFSADEIFDWYPFNKNDTRLLVSTLDRLAEHITSIKFYDVNKYSRKVMVLFPTFDIQWANTETNPTIKEFKGIRIQVHKDFEYILNNFIREFTYFELPEFLSLQSIYAKNAYRYLKQWKTIGELFIPMEKLQSVLCYPDTYKVGNITQRVIRPMKDELSKVFEDLEVIPVRDTGRGKKVLGFQFTWKREEVKKGEFEPNKFDDPVKLDKLRKRRNYTRRMERLEERIEKEREQERIDHPERFTGSMDPQLLDYLQALQAQMK